MYARNARWRRAVANAVEKSGHSCGEAANSADLHRLLLSQRFDVLMLKVSDEEEAHDLTSVIADVKQPLHTILVGDASALPLLPLRRSGTYRFVPGRASAQDLGRLVDVSISSGTWDEGLDENGATIELQEVDIEEAIEDAAVATYADAKRKRQRFHSAVVGTHRQAFADPALLRRVLARLMGLAVALAPTQALISVEAEAGRSEWQIRLRTSGGRRLQRKKTYFAEALRQEASALASIARDLAKQGGMLWVELLGTSGLAFSVTLPLPREDARMAIA